MGYPFLSTALVKCGEPNKPISDRLDIGKVCGESSWTLSCDNSRQDTRVIVTKFKDSTSAKTPDSKKNGKKRTRKANDFCHDNTTDGTCTFALSDVTLKNEVIAPETTFIVKFMCSYADDPVTATTAQL